MIEHKYKHNDYIFKITIDNISMLSTVTTLAINDFIVLVNNNSAYDFLQSIGYDMINNMYNKSLEIQDRLKNINTTVLFKNDMIYFRIKNNGNWHIIENDDFKNLHDWILATIDPETYANRLRKVKLKKLMI